MQVVSSTAFRRMPWKNGKGETAEIAVTPPGADLAGFDWRISMATVAEDGPFSAFPGIDRTLAVLDGAGLRLSIGGAAPVALTPADAPLAFPADVSAAATLIGGPVHDLNVMTRRGRFRHRMSRIATAGEIAAPSAVTVVFALAALDVRCGADHARLARLDAVFALPGERLRLGGAVGAAVLLIGIDPA